MAKNVDTTFSIKSALPRIVQPDSATWVVAPRSEGARTEEDDVKGVSYGQQDAVCCAQQIVERAGTADRALIVTYWLTAVRYYGMIWFLSKVAFFDEIFVNETKTATNAECCY